MKHIFCFLLLLCLGSYSLIAQNPKDSGTDITDTFSNHIIDSCLLSLYPNADEHILGHGRNYRYLSFRLAIENKPDSVKIINFGEKSTHRPSLMLVLVISNSKLVNQILLCRHSLDSDFAPLKGFFALYPIKEKYKLEILDIWVQSRKGVIRTDCYIH
jgi:hypothetical protein